jgi:hypothetical protein
MSDFGAEQSETRLLISGPNVISHKFCDTQTTRPRPYLTHVGNFATKQKVR